MIFYDTLCVPSFIHMLKLVSVWENYLTYLPTYLTYLPTYLTYLPTYLNEAHSDKVAVW